MKGEKLEFTVRTFQPEDLERVVYINRTCLPENYTPSFFMEHHRKYPEAFLVATIKSVVVGYVMSRVEWGLSYVSRGIVKRGHIVSIAVLPEYRRMGIASELLEKAMKALREVYGCREVYLEVRVSNIPAISLYNKFGYRRVKTIKSYYLDGEDAYLMAREL